MRKSNIIKHNRPDLADSSESEWEDGDKVDLVDVDETEPDEEEAGPSQSSSPAATPPYRVQSPDLKANLLIDLAAHPNSPPGVSEKPKFRRIKLNLSRKQCKNSENTVPVLERIAVSPPIPSEEPSSPEMNVPLSSLCKPRTPVASPLPTLSMNDVKIEATAEDPWKKDDSVSPELKPGLPVTVLGQLSASPCTSKENYEPSPDALPQTSSPTAHPPTQSLKLSISRRLLEEQLLKKKRSKKKRKRSRSPVALESLFERVNGALNCNDSDTNLRNEKVPKLRIKLNVAAVRAVSPKEEVAESEEVIDLLTPPPAATDSENSCSCEELGLFGRLSKPIAGALSLNNSCAINANAAKLPVLTTRLPPPSYPPNEDSQVGGFLREDVDFHSPIPPSNSSSGSHFTFT